MRDEGDARPRLESVFAFGGALDDLSVEEITERIEALRAEIERLETARAKKAAANAMAEAFFRK
jgi:uncharacterized small protein (DUF1192 family)